MTYEVCEYFLAKNKKKLYVFFKSALKSSIVITKLAGFSVFSLIVLMIIPVYADVDKAGIDEGTFTIEGKFTISGTISDADRVTLLAAMKGPGT